MGRARDNRSKHGQGALAGGRRELAIDGGEVLRRKGQVEGCGVGLDMLDPRSLGDRQDAGLSDDPGEPQSERRAAMLLSESAQHAAGREPACSIGL